MTAHLVVGVRYRLGGCDGLIALLSLVGCPLLVRAHLVVGVRYRLGRCDGLIALLSLVVDVRYLVVDFRYL